MSQNPPLTNQHLPRNIGLGLLRVTEAAALAAGRWVGSGNYDAAHHAATEAMRRSFGNLDINGRIVVGEERRLTESSPLASGNKVGSGNGSPLDLVVDPIDGTSLVVNGFPGAISAIAAAPRGKLWSPYPAVYMHKIIVDAEAANALLPEVMDAPVGWTLALIARVKKKAVRDLDVIVLYKRRHEALIEEIRQTGARVWLRTAADIEGALVAATTATNADVLMGIGGTAEGLLSACAVKALGGGMLARLAPQSEDEQELIVGAGHDLRRILTVDELVQSEKVVVAATGVTRSWLLNEVDYVGNTAEFHSMLLRGETGARRIVHTKQRMNSSTEYG